jgi:ornithine cyclodeaminase/alanine dehydrogenase-like protein (mu-crystallin family)
MGHLLAEDLGPVVRHPDGGEPSAGQQVELGRLVDDPSLGRRGPEEVTLFKSVGVAVQDVAVGVLALRRAAEAGANVEVPWM